MCVILLILFSLAFASASVNVHNLTLQSSYFPYELIKGEINLTISDEDFNSVITSNLEGEVLLSAFLEDNGADYSCTPIGCLSDYTFSGNEIEKTLDVSIGESLYIGFVLYGSNVDVTGLSFDIESDFGEGQIMPLEIKFFEKSTWQFKKFSDTEYISKDYGCYDEQTANIGPLIRESSYCEKISIPETGSLRIGALVNISDDKELTMALYSYLDSTEISECDFNPSTEDFCEINAGLGEVFSAGNYYVCVEAAQEATNYRLYSETTGTNCGFVNLQDSGQDYAIFAMAAKYENAQGIGSPDFSGFVQYANQILSEKYLNECSDGCVLPLEITGVSQNLDISNIVLDYTKLAGDEINNVIYDLQVIPAKVDFSGVLDLELLGFEVEPDDDEFKLYFDGSKEVDEEIEVLPAPIIKSVYPTNPPAGLLVTFYAEIEFDNNQSVSYNWNFGDNETKTTSENSATHVYDKIKNYTLTLRVSAGNLSSSKSFVITSISPEQAVKETLNKKNQDLNKTIREINKFPAWYQGALEKIANITYYTDALKRLETEESNAVDEDDFLDVAKSLYELDVPSSVFISEEKTFPLLITDLNDINPETIQSIAGGTSEDDLSKYKNPILQWQNENIDATFSFKKISLLKESGRKQDALVVYSLNVKSNSDVETYFVIGKERGELFFKQEDSDIRRQGDFTVIIFDENELKTFELYYEGSEDAVFFVSPKLSLLPIEVEIGICNYNGICQKDLGENYKNCRADCKPWGWVVFYIFLILVFVLILYTGLQMWYKTRYEKFLFKDRRYLFNLLMFIANARVRGKRDSEIIDELKKHKWSREQIIYALKKSRGQRTGMYEIIPIEKLFAYVRLKKASKKLAIQQQLKKSMINRRF